MSIYHITVIGGDLRQCYLAEYLQSSGHIVTCFQTVTFSYRAPIKITAALPQALTDADIIIGPVPFSKDTQTLFLSIDAPEIYMKDFLKLLHPRQTIAGGSIPKELARECLKRDISVIDFMKSDSLIIQNAYFTAEGLLARIITETNVSLKQLPILILGYGNCGFMIAEMLLFMQARITIFDIDINRLALAKTRPVASVTQDRLKALLPDFSIIINTIPAHILTTDCLEQISQDCLIFDIASEPGGFSKKGLEEMNLKRISCPGIPGNCMPKSAARLIGDTILRSM